MSEKRQYVFDVLCKLLPHRFISSEKIEGKNHLYDVKVSFADISSDIEVFERNKINLISFQDVPVSDYVEMMLISVGKNPSKERGFPHYLISTSEMNYGDNSIVGPIPNMDFNGFNLKNDIDRNTKGVK